jgi:predicted nuclease with TOPRIM domain
LQKENEQLR